MEMTEMQNGQTMDLKGLCVYILRRWRLLVIAALVGAVLFGGYRLAVELVVGPKQVLTEEEQTDKQEELDDLLESIADTRKSIQDRKTELSDLQKSKSQYEAMMKQATEAAPLDAAMAVDLVEVNEKIAEKKSSIKSTNSRIEELEEYIVDLEKDKKELKEEIEETVPRYTAKDIVMGGAVGLVLGLFLACAYVFIRACFEKTLRSGEELRRWYGIPLLCSFYEPAALDQRASRGKIDRLIDRIEGCEAPKDPEAEYAVAAAKLELLGEPKTPIMLTGTVAQEQLNAAAAALQAQMSVQYTIFAAENPLKHPKSMSRLPNVQVVLVEAAGTSEIKAVSGLVELLKLSKVPILAAVVL